jgi:hypothetical protein
MINATRKNLWFILSKLTKYKKKKTLVNIACLSASASNLIGNLTSHPPTMFSTLNPVNFISNPK